MGNRKIPRKLRVEGNDRLYKSRKRPNPTKNKEEGVKSSKSASAKKIKLTSCKKVPTDYEMHNKIIDFLLVFTTLSTLVNCAFCGGKVSFKSTHEEGLAFKLEVACEKCKKKITYSLVKK